MTSDGMEPLSGQGPTVELAAELRARKTAANLTFKDMAAKCHSTTKTLSEAANGRTVPSWDVTAAFLNACDVPADEQEVVRKLWDKARAVSAELRPAELTAHPTHDDVVGLLRHVMSRRGVTTEYLCRHIDDIRRPVFKIGARLRPARSREAGAKRAGTSNAKEPWIRPSPQDITASLDTRTQPLNIDILVLALAACGASHNDILYWRDHAGAAIAATSQQPSAPAREPHGTALPRNPTALDDTSDPPLIGDTGTSPPAVTDDAPMLDGGSSRTRSSWWLGRRARLWWASGFTAALLAAGGIVTVRLLPSARPTTTTPRVAAGQPTENASAFPTAPLPQAPRPARAALNKMATDTARLPAIPVNGPVVYTHATVWRLDDTLDSDEPFTMQDEQRWRRPDGTGILRTTALPPDGPQPTTRPLPPATTQTLDPTTAGLAAVIPSDDPGILDRQLTTHGPGTASAATTLAAITALYQQHCLQPTQRAAALSLLADTAGLQTDGQGEDRLNRVGISVTTTTDTRQHRALLDPATGELLSVEVLTLPARADKVTAPTVTYAIAIHPCSYRASLN